jgi:glycine/D-amino acid oxidase-like deaminating enzyme
MPLLDREQIRGWKAVWNTDGGWLAAAKAINAIGEYLAKSGVNFGFYGAGTFAAPLLAEGVCVGVRTANGAHYYADKVVLAAGAWSPALVDLQEQCVSKAWVYAHMQLSPQEARKYKDCPVVYHGDYGFFFEPNEQGVIKVSQVSHASRRSHLVVRRALSASVCPGATRSIPPTRIPKRQRPASRRLWLHFCPSSRTRSCSIAACAGALIRRMRPC